jgi:diadenosine tetraphosphate (Ap4A) HIT family hydrolase
MREETKSGEVMFERFQMGWESYHRRSRSGPCFICAMLAGDPDFRHHIVYEDESTIAFLNRYPVMYGYVLVASKEHREQVTGDFSVEEYLGLQRVIHGVAEAVRRETGAERVYILSLGSNQGNAHVHWHIAPLPPGVPYQEQQYAALTQDSLDIPEEEKVAYAARLRRRMQ